VYPRRRASAGRPRWGSQWDRQGKVFALARGRRSGRKKAKKFPFRGMRSRCFEWGGGRGPFGTRRWRGRGFPSGALGFNQKPSDGACEVLRAGCPRPEGPPGGIRSPKRPPSGEFIVTAHSGGPMIVGRRRQTPGVAHGAFRQPFLTEGVRSGHCSGRARGVGGKNGEQLCPVRYVSIAGGPAFSSSSVWAGTAATSGPREGRGTGGDGENSRGRNRIQRFLPRARGPLHRRGRVALFSFSALCASIGHPLIQRSADGVRDTPPTFVGRGKFLRRNGGPITGARAGIRPRAGPPASSGGPKAPVGKRPAVPIRGNRRRRFPGLTGFSPASLRHFRAGVRELFQGLPGPRFPPNFGPQTDHLVARLETPRQPGAPRSGHAAAKPAGPESSRIPHDWGKGWRFER